MDRLAKWFIQGQEVSKWKSWDLNKNLIFCFQCAPELIGIIKKDNIICSSARRL